MALLQIFALLVNFILIHGGSDVAFVVLLWSLLIFVYPFIVRFRHYIYALIFIGLEESLRAVDSHVHFDVYASAIAKAHYNPWYCNYFKEPGFKCTDCNTALHCFPGNFALLIQCAGRLPYCSNGYCAATKAERCTENPSKFKLPAGDKNKLKEPIKDVNTGEENNEQTTNTARTKRAARRHF